MTFKSSRGDSKLSDAARRVYFLKMTHILQDQINATLFVLQCHVNVKGPVRTLPGTVPWMLLLVSANDDPDAAKSGRKKAICCRHVSE